MPAAEREQRHVRHLVEHAQRRAAALRRVTLRDARAKRRRRGAAVACVPASAPMRSMSSAMPSIVRGSASNTAMPRARSHATCAGVVHGHVTIEVGRQHDDALEIERRDVADDGSRCAAAGG